MIWKGMTAGLIVQSSSIWNDEDIQIQFIIIRKYIWTCSNSLVISFIWLLFWCSCSKLSAVRQSLVCPIAPKNFIWLFFSPDIQISSSNIIGDHSTSTSWGLFLLESQLPPSITWSGKDPTNLYIFHNP